MITRRTPDYRVIILGALLLVAAAGRCVAQSASASTAPASAASSVQPPAPASVEPTASASAQASAATTPPAVRGTVVSGLQPGEDVMPFTSNVVTGPYRGMQHCFVCDAKFEQPCMVVFLRQPDEAAGRFAAAFRKALLRSKTPPLAWFVFLGARGSAAEAALEDHVHDFAARNRLTQLNVTVLGDPQGPPGYRVAADAAVTVHVYRRFRVRFNRAWTAAEWNTKTADEASREVLGLLETVATPAYAKGGPAEVPGPPSGFAPAPPPPPFATSLESTPLPPPAPEAPTRGSPELSPGAVSASPASPAAAASPAPLASPASPAPASPSPRAP